ncbi:MAG: hypothetical protein D6713_03990 [Deltaproteobacteria bacterium]|nr:MAG: hypothetical protein D6713_03990 [Deltaproteobacteria bacterium]
MTAGEEKKKISLTRDQALSAKEKEALENYVRSLPVPKKVELAVKGNREVRSILAKDPNKMVARAVITSPRISDEEIISFAQSPNVNEEILRHIAENPQMTKNRQVLVALCNNPRTPVATVMKFLPRLDVRELRSLSRNKNVSYAVQTQAKRILQMKQK